MAESAVLSLTYAGKTRRQRVTLRCDVDQKGDVLTFELVQRAALLHFPALLNCPWTLVYRDDEGDVITLSHALEFAEACRVLLDSAPCVDGLPELQFYVLAKLSLREKLVLPVLQKLVELARQLRHSQLLGRGRQSLVRLAGGAVAHAGHAIEHLRNSEVLSRGRESLGNSAGHTRTLLLSARSGVSTRLRRAGSAVAAGIERRRSSSASSSDPTEFVKRSPTSPTEVMTVDLRQSVAEQREATPALTTEGVENQVQEEQETVYESDADTLCDEEEDREWDIVNHSSGDAIAETGGQWAEQLSVIRAVLVHVDEEQCCDLLAQHNGNVEAVLIELTNV